jgi:Na+-transporting NADH:ubiquinone oxidoreductase subunit B
MTLPANAAGAGRERLLKIQLLALAPASLAAILNSGYQFLRGLSEADDPESFDLRGRIAFGLAGNAEQPGIFDYFLAGLAYLLPILLLALVVGGFWERIVANRRQKPMEPGFVLVALLFTLLLPAAAAFGHVVFGIICAKMLGKAIFGGDGKSFISPALLGVALVQVSFPAASGVGPMWQGINGYSGSEAIALYYRGGEAALAEVGIDIGSAFIGAIPGPLGTTSLLAIALGAALLLLTRVIAWRMLLSQLLGLLVFALLVRLIGGEGELPLHWHLLIGSFAFGAVFIACDPVASPCTNPGRWIMGFLIAALLVLIRSINPTHPDAVVPVLLLAAILAPLVDHAVIAWNIRKRGQRNV